MKSAEVLIDQPFSTRIPFTRDEMARFRDCLHRSGRKAGPWLRTLALRAMNEESGLGDGSTQARELAEFVAAHLPPEQLQAIAAREQAKNAGGAA